MASIAGTIVFLLLIPLILAIILILVVVIVLILVLKKAAAVIGNFGDACSSSTQCTAPLQCINGRCQS